MALRLPNLGNNLRKFWSAISLFQEKSAAITELNNFLDGADSCQSTKLGPAISCILRSFILANGCKFSKNSKWLITLILKITLRYFKSGMLEKAYGSIPFNRLSERSRYCKRGIVKGMYVSYLVERQIKYCDAL